MNSAPLHKNQAGQPSSNGGHFAATPAKTEAPEGLLTKIPATSTFAAAAGVEARAHAAVAAAAPEALRKLLITASPAAATARFRYIDDSEYTGLELAGVYDANDNRITLHHSVSVEASGIGDSFHSSDDIRAQKEFTGYSSNSWTDFRFNLDLTATPPTARERLAAANDIAKAAHDAQIAAAPAAMREIILDAHPDAATATFRSRTNLDYHYIEITDIRDADGERVEDYSKTYKAVDQLGRLFSGEDSGHTSPDFTTELGGPGVYDTHTLDLTV